MITSVKWIADLEQLASENSAYRNQYPFNLLYWDGVRWWADCVNLLKALFNGRDITDRKVGSFQKNLNRTGDINEWQMISACYDRSSDFTRLDDKPRVLYKSGHIGTYLGKEVVIDGTVRNAIECTPAWENGIVYSYVDAYGYRRHHKGGSASGKWELHGMPIKWVEYVEPEPEKDFDDVPESLEKYVKWGVENGIISGFSDNTFRPYDPCTREQFTTMLWRLNGRPQLEFVESVFTDVEPSRNTYKPIMWAVSKDIVRGYGDDTFRPEDPVTRSQAALMLWRWDGRKDTTVDNNPFKDVSNTKSYFKAVMWGASNGIIKGYSDGTFHPDEICQRIHAVIFLYRVAITLME